MTVIPGTQRIRRRRAREFLPVLCKLAADGDRAMLSALLIQGLTGEEIVFIGGCEEKYRSHFISLIKLPVMEAFEEFCSAAYTRMKEKENAETI